MSNGHGAHQAVPSENSPLLLSPDRGARGVSNTVVSNDRPVASQKTIDADTEQINEELKKRVFWALPALAIGIFLAAADQTIVVSSYGKIGSEMKALNNTSWIATAYLLTQTAFQPLYGRLSEIFGRKATLLLAFGIFGLGCLFCGLARTMNQLIAARAVAGIGGGGQTTLVAIVLSDVIPLRERGTWQGYNNIVFAAGLGVGAPLGGFFTDHLGWRWSFLVQVPLTVIGFFNVLIALQLPATETTNWKQKLKRIDFGGAVMLIFAVSTLLIGLDRGPNVSWLSPITLGCLCSSLLFFVLFLFVEMKLASEPFAPSHVLFDRTMLACSLCNFFAFAAWLAITYYLPLYWQAVEDLSAMQAALRLLPGILANVLGSLFAGLVIQRTGKYYWLTVTCFVVFTLGVIPIILFTGWLSTSLWGIWLGTVISGFGNGIGGTTTLVGLISYAGREDQAVGIACLYLFRSLGSVIGISLSAATIQQVLRQRLHQALHNSIDVDIIVDRVRKSLEYIKNLDPEMQGLVRGCYEMATRWSYVLDLILVVGAIGASLFIKEKRILSNHVDIS